MLFDINTILVLVFSLFFAHKIFHLNNVINPFVIFYMYYAVFFFAGLIFADTYHSDGLYISSIVHNLALLAFILTLVGAVVCQKLYNKQQKHILTGTNEIIYIESRNNVDLYASIVLFFIGISFYVFFYLKTGFNILSKHENMEALRITASMGSGKIQLLCIVFTTFNALIIILHKKCPFVFKLICFIIASITLLGFGNRAPLLKFLLALCIMRDITHSNLVEIKLWKLSIIGLFLFIIMVYLGVLRKGYDVNILEYMQARYLWRPFITLYNFEQIYNNFTNTDPLLGYSIIIDLKTILPGYQPNFGTWVKNFLGLRFDGGSITCSYLGIGYINFGIIGIILYPFFYGFAFQYVYIRFYKNSFLSLKKMTYYVLISFSLMGASTVGLLTPIMYYVVPYSIVYITHNFVRSVIWNTIGYKYKHNNC